MQQRDFPVFRVQGSDNKASPWVRKGAFCKLIFLGFKHLQIFDLTLCSYALTTTL